MDHTRREIAMQAEIIGALVNGAITSLAGIFATLLAFRMIGPKPGTNLRFEQWHQRFGGMLKIGGPLLVIVGAIDGTARVSHIYRERSDELRGDWKHYFTADGVSSAEFPRPPKDETMEAMGVISKTSSLNLPRNNIYYALSFSEIPSEAPLGTIDEQLDATRDSIQVLGEQAGQKFELVNEERITEQDVPGRYLTFHAGRNMAMWTKFFIRDSRIYRVIAVAPRSKSPDAMTNRFLDSVRFDLPSR